MRRLVRILSLAVCAVAVLAAGFGQTARADDCRPRAIERLRAAAPDGFAVYQKIRDKKFFLNWIDCSEADLGLSTAVHESVHFITGESDAFPLVNGGEIKRPHEVTEFFAPSLIAGKFKSSELVSTYLRRGSASSATDFLYLLDELNAYTHDLNTAVNLRARAAGEDEQVDHRDGLASLMAFVALYAERAEESEPATWNGLLQPRVAKAVAALWGRAEKVIASSCGIPDFGTDDKRLIRQFCQARPQASLQKILGRAPVCPTACLKSVPVAAGESEPQLDTMPTGSVRPQPAANPLRPFWSRAVSGSSRLDVRGSDGTPEN